jgi:hypothetical protein
MSSKKWEEVEKDREKDLENKELIYNNINLQVALYTRPGYHQSVAVAAAPR